ncbi:MAG TPA: hypothetical protein VMR33_16100 [Candidatus Baltobacteraceae bacterium]|nr:hypothetical protein [Candidatus Baltobacteraceae bacterium]
MGVKHERVSDMKDAQSDFYFIDRAEPEQIADTLVDMVKTRISQHAKRVINAATPQSLTALLHVLRQCGIRKAYPAETQLQTTHQLYCGDIRAEAGFSKTMKIMSIAGLVYVGRGANSLLYETLVKKPEIETEFIFLNPDGQSGTISTFHHGLFRDD